MSFLLDGAKSFFGWVGDEVQKIPDAVSVVVGGVEHKVSDVYGGVKTVISDAYGGAKTAVTDIGTGGLSFASQSETILARAEKDGLSPITDTIQTFSLPVMIIAGGLGLMLLYQVGKTSREALPYMPSIIESGGRVAPMFM